MEVAEAGHGFAGAGAANGDEAQALDGAGDEFAVEAAADEDGDAEVAEAPDAGEEAAVPEGEDDGRRDVVAGDDAGVADVAVAEGDAETADGEAREAGEDGEGEPLLQRVGVRHELSLPVGVWRVHFPTTAESLRPNYACLWFGYGLLIGVVGGRPHALLEPIYFVVISCRPSIRSCCICTGAWRDACQ